MATKTPAELRAEAAAHEQEAADSFERCDTDGFLSQWAHGINAQEKRLQASILENGGVADFVGLFRVADGKRVRAKIIDTSYGSAWAFVDHTDKLTGEFVSVGWANDEVAADGTVKQKGRGSQKRKALGLYEAHETAPAKAKTWAPPGARGLGGATQVRVITVRTDGGFPDDAVDVDSPAGDGGPQPEHREGDDGSEV
jgi:hypothetical protein